MTDPEQKAFSQGHAAGLEEITEMLDKFGTLKYRAGCSTEKTSQELLEQAHAYRHMIHEALAKLFPTPSDAGKDDARDAARLDFMADYQAWISRSRDGDVFSVWRRDDEGNSVPIMGYPQKCFDSPRAAIDAALSSLEVIGKGEKG